MLDIYLLGQLSLLGGVCPGHCGARPSWSYVLSTRPRVHIVYTASPCVFPQLSSTGPRCTDRPSPGSVLLARSTLLPRSWAPRPFLSRLSQLPVPPLLSSVTESAEGSGAGRGRVRIRSAGTGTGPAYTREAFFLPPSHGLEVLVRFCVVLWPSGA